MTFIELVAAVGVITNRPELVAEHQNAVLTAAYELHAADDWWPDRIETVIPATQITSANAAISIDDYLPRLRKIEVIRPFDPNNGNAEGRTAGLLSLEQLTPSSIFDEFLKQKQNYFYLAGQSLVVRTSYYGNPLYVSYFGHASAASPGTFASWIATKYPFALINKAAAKVCTSTGNEETAQRLTRNDCVADLQYLRQNYISNP